MDASVDHDSDLGSQLHGNERKNTKLVTQNTWHIYTIYKNVYGNGCQNVNCCKRIPKQHKEEGDVLLCYLLGGQGSDCTFFSLV